MSECRSEIESTENLALRDPFFTAERNHLVKSLQNIKPPILNLEKNMLTNLLLLGSDKY